MFNLLIPDMLLHCIMTERGLECFPVINTRSVQRKRWWKNKTPEEKAEFSAMRSKVQKETFKNNKALKKNFHKGTSRSKKEFWDNISEEKKQAHIKKMSEGMKRAWDEGDENFGPRIAQERNHRMLNGNVEIQENLSRINDYAGVITPSQMAELNG